MDLIKGAVANFIWGNNEENSIEREDTYFDEFFFEYKV
jgi:hypothetical protein